MTAIPESFPPQIDTLGRRARALAGLGVVLCAVGWLTDAEQFYRSYLFGYLFWVGMALGCLALLMIHHLSGGVWGLGIRRMLEAGARTLYVGLIFFVPVAIGLKSLFVWARPDAVAADPILQQKALYLNVPFFLGRTVFYFACWGAIAYFLSKWSLQRDRGVTTLAGKLQGLSGGGLVALALTITFASVDWAMSLNAHWYSTIYGVLFMVGELLSALAFIILMVALLGQHEPLSAVISRESIHDLGKLLLAFVMLWAYMSVSQLIIVWSANLPEEIPWYVQRFQGAWGIVALVLVLFHFALPFFLLLSRELKRNARALAIVATGLFVVRFLELYWLIAPDLQGHGGQAAHGYELHWLDFAVPLGLGAIWLALFVRELKSRPLLTPGDPELQELLAQEHA